MNLVTDHKDKLIIKSYWRTKLSQNVPVEASNPADIKMIKKTVSATELSAFNKITSNVILSEFTVFAAFYSFLIETYCEDIFDGLIYSESNVAPLGYSFLLKGGMNIKRKKTKNWFKEIAKEIETLSSYINNEETLDAYSNFGFTYSQNGTSNTSLKKLFLKINKNEKEELEFKFLYDEKYFSENVIRSFSENFIKLLTEINDILDSKLETISLVSNDEKQKIVYDFNNTDKAFDRNKTIIDLFEEQVINNPSNIALVFEDKEFTYKELNQKANSLAHFLRLNYAIKPNDLVGIKLDRSEKLIITILAVLKSGAAYVPIDLSYPEDRIEYIEKDSNCKVVVDQEIFDNFYEDRNSYFKTNLAKLNQAQDLAYIIYTSGSTGNPKGVMIIHENVSALIRWAQEEYSSSDFDITYAATSHCFDLSIYEIFFTLAKGKKIRLLRSALEIGKFLSSDTKVLINTVPSVIRKLIEEGVYSPNNVSVLNLAGEAFPVDIVPHLFADKVEVRNLYGPSEDTTYSTCYKLSNQVYNNIPIGKPILNTQTYILNNDLEPVPEGISGRLFVAGLGVAKGYLNRPELTEQKFVENPFIAGGRMYDTGDLARWKSDGELEFLGRKDFQVKLNGYRIELEEIEHAIAQFSGSITQSVVAVKNINQKNILFAYYTCNDNVDKKALRKYLETKLPAYMIPTFFVKMDVFPLTPNGKINRKALPEKVEEHLVQNDYIAPQSEIEKVLVDIWKEVLGIEKIGINDSFFELGGHSLIIDQVINRIYKRLGKSVSYKFFYSNPDIQQLGLALKKRAYSPILNVPKSDSYPATEAQHRFWMLSQLEGGAKAYQINGAVQINGNIEADLFINAFEEVVKRHEILRTHFQTNDSGVLQQFITPWEQFNIAFSNMDFSETSNPYFEIEQFIENENEQVFDLTNGPLFKAALLQTSETHFVFYLSLHHIISDGWSLEVLSAEVLNNYKNLLAGNENAESPLLIQFKDYVSWLENRSSENDYLKSEKYWLDKFDGATPVLDLPIINKRPAIKTYAGKQLSYDFSISLLNQLKTFSKEQQLTLFTTLMAAVKTLLHRYSNQEEIVVGVPVAGREHPDLENQIGLYLNILAIKSSIDKDDSFLNLLEGERQLLLDAYTHQDYQFNTLVEKLNLKRDRSRSPLFDVMVVLQNQESLSSIQKNSNYNDFILEDYKLARDTSQFDLTFNFVEREGLLLDIQYNTDLYAEEFIESMFLHLENVMKQIIENPEQNVGALNFLTSKEKKFQIEKLNANDKNYSKTETLVDLFEAQALKTPNEIAVVFEDKSWTYLDIQDRSNQLANYLLFHYDVAQGDFVGVKLERNEWVIITMLAILKTGAAYVPIDPNYPQDRIDFIESDSQCKITITQEVLSAFQELDLLAVLPETSLESNDLAYVIYTSGSTGKPKGVMITHRNAAALINWSKEEFSATDFEMLYAVTSYCFDLSVFEFFYPLSVGKQVRILDSSLSFGDYLPEDRKVLINTVPSVVRDLLNRKISFENVTAINMAGEPIPVSLSNELVAMDQEIELRNLYGPSEDTTYSSCYRIDRLHDQALPIGKPISNTQFYVVSDTLNLQPFGVVGELCISGDGVSDGYLNRPELSSEKFVSNPFNKGMTMYKTGDLVYWLSDENLAFVGRKDDQVKVRGYRIELGEIEKVLSMQEEISEAVVLVKEKEDEKFIVAYLVGANINTAEIKNNMSRFLPGYMIPNYFIEVEKIPLTPNRKTNKKALLNLELSALAAGNVERVIIQPANKVEEEVLEIWKRLLNQNMISTSDDFFELGGHSLLLTKLINEYLRVFKVKLDLKEIYSNTVLAFHANLIKKSVSDTVQEIEKIPVQKSYDLSPSQIRFWLLFQIKKKTREFNMFSQYKLPSDLNIENFRSSFTQLINRHEGLRTIFLEKEGVPKQEILNDQKVELPIYSMEAEAEADVFDFEFDLEVFPLFKAALLNKGTDWFLYFNMHHIISDGWSMNVLVRDLMEIYQAKEANELPNLPELTIGYKDYAHWQNQILETEDQGTQKQYWNKKLEGDLPYLQLPFDFPNKAKKSDLTVNSGYYNIFLDNKLKQKIDHLTRSNKVSVFSFFVATLKILLSRLSSENDVIVGIPVANRNHYQLKDMVGCFLNTLMLRDNLDKEKPIIDFVNQVNQTLMEGLANQNYPFESLLEDLNIPRNQHRFPISSVFLNMLDFEATASEKLKSFENLEGTLNAAPKFDLECYIKSFSNAYSINCVFDPELVKSETIKFWIDEYQSIVEQVLGDIKQPVSELRIFEDCLFEYPNVIPVNDFVYFEEKEIDQSIVQRFEKQVLKYPNRIAVTDDQINVSYKELNSKANYFGNEILKSVENETEDIDESEDENKRVALLFGHDATSILGMLSALKAGCCYVPIDTASPLKRIEYILKDAGCDLLLCSEETLPLAGKVADVFPKLKVIKVSFEDTVDDQENLNLEIDPRQEAYVLYTSGSTGLPKGVVQNQRNVLHYIRVYTNNTRISKEDNLSVFSTYTFDASVKDIYGSILNGATVSIYKIAKYGVDNLLPWLKNNQITIMHMVPTIFRYFLKNLNEDEKIEGVRIIDMGGEALYKSDFELFKKHFEKGSIMINDYGPTEATIISQKFLNHESSLSRSNVSLGRPVMETEVYLLDEENNRKGIYEEGEIVFRSDYLSLGYLNRSELTQKAFTIDPLKLEGRIYRSGDIGQMLPNGEVEFVRRKDSQIKLNGLRIELSEIENQLERIEGIEEAIVLLKKINQNEFLTAYIKTGKQLEKALIKASLSEYLPQFMIPDAYVFLDRFPLTRTGKIDRKVLPNPNASSFNTVAYVAPTSKIEKRLVEIWMKIFNGENNQIGINDNFFELGGSSLEAVVLVNNVNKIFNTNLSVENLYNTFNIKTLAGLLDFSISQNQKVNLVSQDRDEIIL